MTAGPVAVMHVISGLGTGGAETMLLRLLGALDPGSFRSIVVSLTSRGTIARRIESLGVEVVDLGLSRILTGPAGLWRFGRAVRRFHPDLVQGWMYHGNLAALLAGRLAAGPVPVLWNVRHSMSDLSHEKPLTRMVIRGCARRSHRPAAIIYNSQVSARQHEALGYASSRRQIIPNGIDTERFAPRHHMRAEMRRRLGLRAETKVIASVGRYHPQKAHSVFLEAASLVAQKRDDVEFLLVGPGVEPGNQELSALVSGHGLDSVVSLAGERMDMPELLATVDVFASSSVWGEGFPTVVAEAMACGVACVVTDVGDSAFLVGDTGKIVAPGDAAALATRWCELLEESDSERRARGSRARERIRRCFGLKRVADRYSSLYMGTVAR